MVKLQDFARQQAVTDRAVQKQLKRYEKAELQGHFERQGPNGTWLDDYAVEFLLSKMKRKPIVVYDRENSDLLKENSMLKSQIIELQQQLKISDEEKRLLQDKADQAQALMQSNEDLQQQLRAAEAAHRAAAEELTQTTNRNAELQGELRDVRAEAAETRKELEELQNQGLFARIFRRKKKDTSD